MAKKGWVFLSYELSDQLSNYGDGERISIERLTNIAKGDTSNNSRLSLLSHTGTHMDFPFHFLADGKNGSEYKAADFVFDNIGIADISNMEIEDYLIRPSHFDAIELDTNLDFLIVKTGFCDKRNEEAYWNYNWGFAPETAAFLREQYPSIRAIGFDLISLSSYQQRPTGRIAHKAFLGESNILIVEDLNLKEIEADTNISQLILSPLRFENADGTPVTIFAKLQ